MDSSNALIAQNMDAIRNRFPALQQTDEQGEPYIFFDAPGGTQAPEAVISAMSEYLRRNNTNTHGQFKTSAETDRMIAAARQAAAALLGAGSPADIHFGANMTTITFHLSRAIRRLLAEGDEIIVTRLDHDANIAPWLALQQTGIEIRWLEFEPESCTLRLEQLAELISPRTKLIAAGYASNAVGTINDVPRIVELAKAAGVMTYIDAVHFAPHGLIDVQALGCDFLVCSAYKFFGPHLGVACIRPAIAEKLMPDRVRPQHPEHPEKFETGTLNHEGLAGLIAAIDYIASLSFEQTGESRRQRISRAMQLVSRYEKSLSQILIQGLQLLPGVTIHGITDLDNPGARTPTVSITVEGRHALEVARALGQKGVFVWDGDFYAVEVVRALHLEAIGGLIRIGLTHYNTPAEIERFLQKLTQILA